MQRDQSLDALRGFAILTMVLSGSIAFGGVLPAWMYHAQVPPPVHQFNPTIPGITWVDLVFPFFLFSMGAAIPLSLQKLEGENKAWSSVFTIAGKRFLLLVFFAYFTQHMKAWVLSSSPAAGDYLLSIAAFVLLFFQFYEYKGITYKKFFRIIKTAAFGIAIILLAVLPFSDGTGFDTKRVDIIILVLANMALFGTLIWWVTRNHPLWRMAVLPVVMAIFLSGKEAGWQKLVYEFSPLPWLYKFYYLKYLFIIIPGTFAGEWLLAKGKAESTEPATLNSVVALLSALLVISNTAFLFGRYLTVNFISSIIICSLLFILLRKHSGSVWNKFLQAGTYLLLLGLSFEAYEGGVKKDSSTYSYYFITSGLAFFMLLFFGALQNLPVVRNGTHFLSRNGRNPMVAYTVGNLLLLPLLQLTGGIEWLNNLNTGFVSGLLRGILFTGAVSLLTIFFVRRRWFWKT